MSSPSGNGSGDTGSGSSGPEFTDPAAFKAFMDSIAAKKAVEKSSSASPPAAFPKAADDELARLHAEIKKFGANRRDVNKRNTAVTRRSPFVAIWESWAAEHTQAGLPNPGNLCYRNVTLQMLAHSAALLRWTWFHFDRHIPGGKSCVLSEDGATCKLCYLNNFLTLYWDSRGGDFGLSVDDLWDPLFHDWNNGEMIGQQDPAELLQDIFSQILDAIPDAHEPSFREIFFTYIVDVEECEGEGHCPGMKYKSEHGVAWPILSLPFSPDSPIKTIQEAVDGFFKEKDHIGECTKCHGSRMKRSALAKPAEQLVVQLNRSDDTARKIEEEIDFSQNIVLRKEHLDPRIGKPYQKNVTYELTSVIFHAGESLQSGHYTSLVRGRTGKWTLLNDEYTKPVDFKVYSKTKEYRQNAYMFMYTRLPKNPTALRVSRYEKIFAQKEAAMAIRPGAPRPGPTSAPAVEYVPEPPMRRIDPEFEMSDYYDDDDDDGDSDGDPMDVDVPAEPPAPTASAAAAAAKEKEKEKRKRKDDGGRDKSKKARPSAGADPAGPYMKKKDFKMNHYIGDTTRQGITRIQYFEYKAGTKQFKVMLDFVVRGYPVNVLKNPMKSGLNAEMQSIFESKKLKSNGEIVIDSTDTSTSNPSTDESILDLT